MNSYQLKLLNEELAIRVTPSVGLDKKWDGGLNFKIETCSKSRLSVDDQEKLFTFMQMLMAVPELIDTDDDIRDRLWDVVQINEREHMLSSRSQSEKRAKNKSSRKKAKPEVIKFSDYKKPKENN